MPKIILILFNLILLQSLNSQQVYYELYIYGDNTNYQLSNGTTVKHNIPLKIGTDEDWKEIDLGFSYILTIKTDGTLWAWGANVVGQIGNGTNTTVQVPTQIGTDEDWSKISAGGGHSLAIKNDGTLWAWGNNTNGRLGDGTTVNKNIPIRIGTDTDWDFISAGIRTSFGIKSDGTLWAWGDNDDSRLGDGTTIDRNIPTKIGTDTDWDFVSASFKHTIAIKTDGTLWGWGLNDAYQLGSGTITPISTPTQIGTDTDWQKVDSYKYHNMGIKTDGTLWAWGNNTFKQLGDGNTTDLQVPTQIGVETTWADVAVGEYHTVATKEDGTLWGWGWNTPGQLGVGSFTSVNLPTQSGSETTWYKVFAGDWFSGALKIAPTYTLSGKITDSGVGISGVSVNNGLESVTTNSSGEYNFTNMPSTTFTITPSNNSYEFDPNSIEIEITSNTTGINFAATRLSDEPNGGDGNGDGTPDYLQNSVVTLKDISDQYYVTIACQDGYNLNETGTYNSNDSEYFYPMGMFEFKINASSANVKIYFHDISSLGNYIYRKVYSGDIYSEFENVSYSIESIGGNSILVATLILVDGGLGDFDGEVNGVIYDPGGPAIPITANIPIWDWWYALLIIPIMVYSYKQFS